MGWEEGVTNTKTLLPGKRNNKCIQLRRKKYICFHLFNIIFFIDWQHIFNFRTWQSWPGIPDLCNNSNFIVAIFCWRSTQVKSNQSNHCSLSPEGWWMVSEWMVSVFERSRTSLCLKFFAKPFWDLNLGLAIKTQSRGFADKNVSLSKKCKKIQKKCIRNILHISCS